MILASPDRHIAEAEIAARNWGEPLAPPRLISARENYVFDVHLAQGRAALRLHRPSYQASASILSELTLTKALADARFRVPAPIAAQDGRLLVETGPRHASLIEWCGGEVFGTGAAPLANAPQQMQALGRVIAELHGVCDQLALPDGFARPNWDAAGFLGTAPLWGRFWDSPAVTAPERAELMAFRDAAAKALPEGADYGLIHADLLRENIMVENGALTLIDFDDCGFGYRLFDLATALVQSLTDADLPEQIDALLAGYNAVRPLGDTHRRDLTLFCALRLTASIGWLASRAPPSDPGHRLRIERALPLIRLWQAGGNL